MPVALFALALGAFGIGATEFAMMGVLPAVAADLHVSIPQAGYLITGYALGVVVGAPLLTAVSGRFARKNLLLGMMAVFTLGNFAAAAAPGYGWLMAARVLTALPHGAFFGVGSVVATGLVGRERAARGISLMFTGLTVANVVGVPAATALGNAVSWRLAFALIGGLGLLAVLGLAVLVPPDPAHVPVRLRTELRAFTRPAVLLTLAVGTFGFAGVFATYSYISPTLTTLAGVGPAGLAVALALFGLGSSAGNLVGGRLADRALRPAAHLALGLLAAVLALFALTVHNEVTALITLTAIGLASGLVIPPVQLQIIRAAEAAPTLAAASVQSGFNIANAGGAALGGALIGAGFGYTAPSLAGAALALIGLGLALVPNRVNVKNLQAHG
ncbi:MFS transporter [Amycolatopsis sp. PS_44_ISF1]|uniref:MFS transporter n=1 Tax=Amycolatopsis sp. PS_44_ISF1 TaxID=2974917 RepID=UPI0028DDDEC9|nr:MFS transporter [Amycolatopsis sp. PS_44_ISF1]MDT8913454.1 MFS transporter [Amycolatopsis sp. PS_44_ISF1]